MQVEKNIFLYIFKKIYKTEGLEFSFYIKQIIFKFLLGTSGGYGLGGRSEVSFFLIIFLKN